MTKKIARHSGGDLSTSALKLFVMSQSGEFDLASIPMRGSTSWKNESAHDLSEVPKMILEALFKLHDRGWDFSYGGSMSFSVRQHDMVLLDQYKQPVIPALSWRFKFGKPEIKEIKIIKELGAEKIVGPIENRFIIVKLMWVLNQCPSLKNRVYKVMTTGDWIGGKLTDTDSLSTSDGLSNGLLDQKTKTLAKTLLNKVGINYIWFPSVIQSGEFVDNITGQGNDPAWRVIRGILEGWEIYSPLGDNHGAAVGCGLYDESSIIVSAGTSGTVNRICEPTMALAGKSLSFEYYQKKLSLIMMHHCGSWYDYDFKKSWCTSMDHPEMNKLALSSCNQKNIIITQENDRVYYPSDFAQLPLGNKIASVQQSIALILSSHVGDMVIEVINGQPIKKIILTGGICRSKYFQQCFKKFIHRDVNDEIRLFISALDGPIAFEATARGALINAAIGDDTFSNLKEAATTLCPVELI